MLICMFIIISFKCTNISGKVIYRRSAGMEGFKNCRKGTNVAGQSTGLTVSAVS